MFTASSSVIPNKMFTIPVAPWWVFGVREHKERRTDDRFHPARIVQTEGWGQPCADAALFWEKALPKREEP